jgi:hypothetical protein
MDGITDDIIFDCITNLLKMRSSGDAEKIDEDSLEIVINFLKSTGSKLDFGSFKSNRSTKLDSIYQMIEKKVVHSMKEKNSYSYRLRFLAEDLIILRKVSIIQRYYSYSSFGLFIFFEIERLVSRRFETQK